MSAALGSRSSRRTERPTHHTDFLPLHSMEVYSVKLDDETTHSNTTSHNYPEKSAADMTNTHLEEMDHRYERDGGGLFSRCSTRCLVIFAICAIVLVILSSIVMAVVTTNMLAAPNSADAMYARRDLLRKYFYNGEPVEAAINR